MNEFIAVATEDFYNDDTEKNVLNKGNFYDIERVEEGKFKFIGDDDEEINGDEEFIASFFKFVSEEPIEVREWKEYERTKHEAKVQLRTVYSPKPELTLVKYIVSHKSGEFYGEISITDRHIRDINQNEGIEEYILGKLLEDISYQAD